MNPLKPELMNTDERLAEIYRILGLGLVRLKARESTQVSGERRESCLHFPPDRSGHETPTPRGDA